MLSNIKGFVIDLLLIGPDRYGIWVANADNDIRE